MRQGDSGASMFIVHSGQVKVTIEPGNREVARTDPGGFFGEMSLLTGDPRTATVSATCDSVLLEIPADGFRQIALAQPAVVEAVGVAVVARRAGLDQARAEAALLDASLREQSRSLIGRVRRFLRLPGGLSSRPNAAVDKRQDGSRSITDRAAATRFHPRMCSHQPLIAFLLFSNRRLGAGWLRQSLSGSTDRGAVQRAPAETRFSAGFFHFAAREDREPVVDREPRTVRACLPAAVVTATVAIAFLVARPEPRAVVLLILAA